MEYWLDGRPDLVAVYNNMLDELNKRKDFTPARENVFRMFEIIRPEQVRVVIIGQDPYKCYRNDHYADGIAFSLTRRERNGQFDIGGSQGVIESALRKPLRSHNLQYLVEQGVLLLNTYLTTPRERGEHTFWMPFTVGILKRVLDLTLTGSPIVVCAWGFKARELASYAHVDNYTSVKYYTACHPSPKNVGSYSFVVSGGNCLNEIKKMFPDIEF